jgi:hypothetical protein
VGKPIKLLNMNINLSAFWGENYYNHPALTPEMLTEAEAILAVKLPERYIELLKIQNGGYTKGFIYPMKEKTSWAEDHVPLPELSGILTNQPTYTSQNVLNSQYLINEWGLPEKQVLLAGDGHWWITLDYRTSATPSVRWLDMESNEDIFIANSFEEFIDGLLPEEPSV